jgi:hypothetical protein
MARKKPQATERYARPAGGLPLPGPTEHQRTPSIRMSAPHESWLTRAAEYVRDYDPMATHGTSLDNPVSAPKKKRRR